MKRIQLSEENSRALIFARLFVILIRQKRIKKTSDGKKLLNLKIYKNQNVN